MKKSQLEQIKRNAREHAKNVLQETQDAFLEISEIMYCLQNDIDRLSSGGQDRLSHYWKMTYVNENKDYTWRKAIEAFKEINQLMNCLESDRDRFSSAGKKCLDNYWLLRDNFIANKGGNVKEFLIS